MTPTAKVVSLLSSNAKSLPGINEDLIYAFGIDKNDDDSDSCIVVVS